MQKNEKPIYYKFLKNCLSNPIGDAIHSGSPCRA